ncbi:hypothetical protein HK102_004291 [Quaeritorhiza haematococci]|nr:hypothetical protein HK102_004291 [Quaeritorhiza haematococci]
MIDVLQDHQQPSSLTLNELERVEGGAGAGVVVTAGEEEHNHTDTVVLDVAVDAEEDDGAVSAATPATTFKALEEDHKDGSPLISTLPKSPSSQIPVSTPHKTETSPQNPSPAAPAAPLEPRCSPPRLLGVQNLAALAAEPASMNTNTSSSNNNNTSNTNNNTRRNAVSGGGIEFRSANPVSRRSSIASRRRDGDEEHPDSRLWLAWRVWLVIKVVSMGLMFGFSVNALVRDWTSPCDTHLLQFLVAHTVFLLIQFILSSILLVTLPYQSRRWTWGNHQRVNVSRALWACSTIIFVGQAILIPIGFAFVRNAEVTCLNPNYIYDLTYNLILIEVVIFVFVSLPMWCIPCLCILADVPQYHGVSRSVLRRMPTIVFRPPEDPEEPSSNATQQQVNDPDSPYPAYPPATSQISDEDLPSNVVRLTLAPGIGMVDVGGGGAASGRRGAAEEGQNIFGGIPVSAGGGSGSGSGSGSVGVEVGNRAAADAVGAGVVREAAVGQQSPQRQQASSAAAASRRGPGGRIFSWVPRRPNQPVSGAGSTGPTMQQVPLGVDHCVICMEPWEVGAKLKQLPCRHVFHNDCIKVWFDEHHDW